MELPEIITRLPEVELPIPSTTVRTSLLQSEHGQLVFFQILKDVELPPHSHKGQWGTVLEGMVELTVSGSTRSHSAGSSYYIRREPSTAQGLWQGRRSSNSLRNPTVTNRSRKVLGLTPNPSIERTCQRPLRALWPAAHVER